MDQDYALHVLRLPKTYTMGELRANYKKMALVLHPDRHTLDKESANQLFSILTDSYKLLKSMLEGGSTSAHDADWNTLRSGSVRASDEQGPQERGHGHSQTQTQTRGRPRDLGEAQAPPAPSGKFNISTFNDKFVDTRLGDENDRGYSNWMQRLTPDQAAERQKKNLLDDRRRAAENSKDSMTVYEPQALPSSTSIPHSELGVSRVQDFGRHQDRTNTGYTDYKIAHMTSSCLIDPEIVRSRRQFNTIAEFEQARSESESGVMTSDERAYNARQEQRATTKESSRMDAMRARDEVVAKHHAKIHQFAIR